jgi:hypothetical protein
MTNRKKVEQVTWDIEREESWNRSHGLTDVEKAVLKDRVLTQLIVTRVASG